MQLGNKVMFFGEELSVSDNLKLNSKTFMNKKNRLPYICLGFLPFKQGDEWIWTVQYSPANEISDDSPNVFSRTINNFEEKFELIEEVR